MHIAHTRGREIRKVGDAFLSRAFPKTFLAVIDELASNLSNIPYSYIYVKVTPLKLSRQVFIERGILLAFYYFTCDFKRVDRA